jgi:amino acid adenylation domain-containing protein
MSDKNLEQLQKAILLKRMQKQMKAQPAAPAAERIPQADRGQPLPLSHAQQRLWFLDQLDAAAGAAYHLPAGLRLQGRLDRAALRRTLDRVVARHESLRTTFGSAQGRPVQRIAAPAPMALAEDDLRHLRGAEQEAALARLAADEAVARFDLARGPLIRARLVQLGEESHVLLVTQHHIVSDGWSTGVLVREVAALYAAFCEGRPDPLPELPLQYADYAAWQRGWLDDETLARQGNFWRAHLQGAPALLELPTDRARPAQQSYAGGQARFELGAELSSSLRTLAQRHGATLFMTLLAGWSVLMARLSGQDDVVTGTPVANRQRSDIEGLIGFFVNTLAIRVRLDARPTVAGLLAQVKADTLDAYAHQDLPFDHVVEVLQPTRSMAYAPLFQVMLSLNNTPAGGALQLPGLSATPYAQAASTTQFDLNLALHDDGTAIGGTLTYASDLFDASSAERLLAQLHSVLAAMAADDAMPVHALPLMDAAQAAQVAAFSARQGRYESDDLLHQLFERQAAMRPEAVAVSYGDEHLSYRALNERANRIAHALLAQGVQPDDRVAVCLERGTDMVAALLGVLKAGAGYVPLDPAYPAERLAYTLGDCLPAALVSTAALAAGLPAQGLATLTLDADGADAALLAAQPAHNPLVPGLLPGHLAYVIYTSGSTGMPKGVMVEHRNVVRLMASTEPWFNFGAADTWTLFHSFAFDFSVWEMWGALLYGGRLVVVPYLTSRSPQDFYALLCREGVTVLNQTPSAFRQLIAAQGEHGAPHRLRCVVFGGEALETATLQPWYARPANAATQLVNMYGITETTVHVTYRALSAEDALRGGGSPIGRAIPDLEVHILDPLGQPVPVGVTGEMYVGGAGVARGYLNRQELTAQRFIAHPNAKHPEMRLYRSGDLARWLPDGGIEYLGRNDFQVKIRGFRIELGEIEARLAACAGVREAVVLAREDSPGDKRLVAYVVAQDGCAPEPAALRSELARTLAEHMLPTAFVLLDELPLTTNGKLDRKVLPAPASGAVAAHAYQAPSTPLESLLCAAWAEVLGLARVGVQDNYFDIGGDSIRSIAIVAQVREQGVEMAIVDLFKHPSVAALAAVLAGRQDAPAPSPSPCWRRKTRPACRTAWPMPTRLPCCSWAWSTTTRWSRTPACTTTSARTASSCRAGTRAPCAACWPRWAASIPCCAPPSRWTASASRCSWCMAMPPCRWP